MLDAFDYVICCTSQSTEWKGGLEIIIPGRPWAVWGTWAPLLSVRETGSRPKKRMAEFGKVIETSVIWVWAQSLVCSCQYAKAETWVLAVQARQTSRYGKLGNERHLHVCIPNTRLRLMKLIPDHWLCQRSHPYTQGTFRRKAGPNLQILDYSDYNLVGLGKVELTVATSVFWNNREEIALFYVKAFQIFENSFYSCLLSFLPLAKHTWFLQLRECDTPDWAGNSRWGPGTPQ